MANRTGTVAPRPGHDALIRLLEADERNLAWLSRRTGRSVSHLYRVSTGEREISGPLAADLAVLFNVPIETFLPATTAPDAVSEPGAAASAHQRPGPRHTTTKEEHE